MASDCLLFGERKGIEERVDIERKLLMTIAQIWSNEFLGERKGTEECGDIERKIHTITTQTWLPWRKERRSGMQRLWEEITHDNYTNMVGIAQWLPHLWTQLQEDERCWNVGTAPWEQPPLRSPAGISYWRSPGERERKMEGGRGRGSAVYKGI